MRHWRALWLLLLLGLGAEASFAFQEGQGEVPISVPAPTPPPFSIALRVEPIGWVEGTPIWARLVATSHVNAARELAVHPSLRLEKIHMTGDEDPCQRDVYWSPLDVNRCGFLTSDTTQILHVEPGGTVTCELEVAKLSWERAILSAWPECDLFDIAQPGEYSLHVEFEVDADDKDHFYFLRSNKVKIAINPLGSEALKD